MARKKQSEKTTSTDNTIDLGKDIGLTVYGDVKHSAILNRLPTGFPHLDYILGGGLPFGRMVEVLGKNASGKSTFAIILTAMAQTLNVPVVWVDVEGTADPERLAQLGINFQAGGVYMVEPDVKKNTSTGLMEKVPMTVEIVAEKLTEVIGAFSVTKKPLLVIWDSVAQTPTATELERGVGDKQPGIKAKALSQFSAQIAPLMTNSQTLFVAINQARDEMGSMFGGIDSPGGHALHHWASLRLEVQQASQIKEKTLDAFGSEEVSYVGHIMRIKTEKSKVSRPKQKAEIYLISDKGLSLEENVYRACLATNKQYGFISGGAWKKYKALDGTEHQFNSDKNWVEYLSSEAGRPILEELFGRMMAVTFPEGYAPYSNQDVDIRQHPLYKAVENYQKLYGTPSTEASSEPLEADVDEAVQGLLDNI